MSRLYLLTVLLFFCLASLHGEARAATAIVTRADDRNLTIANCPSTAGLQDCSLREAITFVNSNPGADTIQFQNPNMTVNLTLGELNIGATLTIEGNNSTVLRATGAEFRILSVNADSLITINNLTISGGSASLGGGVFLFGGVPSANLTLDNCVVSGNQSSSNGGGIFVSQNARLTLSATTVSGNSSQANGGGIYNQGTLNITDSAINGNSARMSGGISNFLQGSLTMQNSRVNGNRALSLASGLHNNGFAAIGGTTIDGNASTGISLGGRLGGSIINDGTLFLDGSTVSRNTTVNFSDVAGIWNFAVMVVTNSTVSGNNNTAIANNGGLLSLTNTTVSGNQSFDAAVENDTETNLRNTIIAGNSSIGGEVKGNFASLGNNLIGNVGNATGFGASGDIVGTNAAPVDAHLRPLALYGGATETQPPLPASRAVNNGNNCVLTANACGNNSALTTDQRGFPRGIGGAVDIGAAEFHLAPAGTLLANGRRALPNATLNQNYSQPFEAFGELYVFEVTEGALPPGMSLGAPLGLKENALLSTDTLSGTPTVAGIYQFTVTARNLANPNLTVSNNYTLAVMSPTAANVSVSGRVLTTDGRGVRNAVVMMTDAFGGARATRTSTFGYYRFNEVEAGRTYVFQVVAKRFRFAPRVVAVSEELSELNFTALEN